MHILVTNDDGVSSPGLQALADAMRKLGTVCVVAPEREQGAVGHSITLHKPLRLNRIEKDIYAVNGTPSDCVVLAVTQLLRRRPALIVSGVNRGVNLGDDVTYSGTVSAALEGALLGVPSLAISQEGTQTFNFKTAAYYAWQIAKTVLERGLPEEAFLNVNIPDRLRDTITGVQMTSLSRRRFEGPVVEKIDPRGRKYYWIAGTRVSWARHTDSDYQAVRQGMVSITPVHIDLTHYQALEQLRSWEDLFNKTGHRQSGAERGVSNRTGLSGGSTGVRQTRRSSKAKSSAKRQSL
ncbi:MAG: 5'/3'-nucleotidase SurE [Nitrospirales bacterium]|nr:5'/3'-nucleotidase SurE [Nitrospirales bacterium]